MRLLQLDRDGEVSLTADLIKNIPDYAILSHTWGADNDEVTYKDLLDGSAKSKIGYEKIRLCSEQTKKDDLRHFWVDSCCIDKSSSAELTESINAMYRWYQRAKVCYVFLSDLPASASLGISLRECRWFFRGWTLQELIAPGKVHFFDQHWKYRGSKRDIVDLLCRITNITPAILLHEQPLSSIAVAQRMSWAAHRETTRIEDTAYCLLGIFGVNMPLIYGEEEKAFRRLQEEIIKAFPDFSIFAWRLPSTSKISPGSNTRYFCGVLAEGPFAFAGCTKITREPGYQGEQFWMSGNGVKGRVKLLYEGLHVQQSFRHILPLDCWWTSAQHLGVRVRQYGPDQFVREDPWNLVEDTQHCGLDETKERFFLAKLPGTDMLSSSVLSDTGHFIAQSRSYALQIRHPPSWRSYDEWPSNRFDVEDQVFFVNRNSVGRSDACSIKFRGVFFAGSGRREVKVLIECMFFAVGWSATDASSLQCTLVNRRLFDPALKELHSDIVSWDSDRRQVLEGLRWHKIPKCTSATFDIPGREASLVLSFKTTMEYVVRSKSAGECEIAVDFLFSSPEIYKSVRNSGVLTTKALAKLYNSSLDELTYCGLFDAALAFKAPWPRKRNGKNAPAGGWLEADMHGSQQYMPLLELPLGVDLVPMLEKIIKASK